MGKAKQRICAANASSGEVAKEVSEILGLNASDSVRYIDDDEKSYVSRKHLGLKPVKDMLIDNEPSLDSMILRSRKPAAKKFKRWITHEAKPHSLQLLCRPSSGINTYRVQRGNIKNEQDKV